MKQKYFLLLMLSSLLTSYSFRNLQYVFIFFSLVPFFLYAVKAEKKLQAFFNGAIFGFFYGFSNCLWVHKALKDYSTASYYGILIVLLSAILFAIMYGLVSLSLHFISNKNYQTKYKYVINCLAIASLYALFEELFSILFQGLPFYNLRLGVTLSGNLYLVQLASIGGVALLTFVIVLVNIFLADFISNRNRSTGLSFVLSLLLPITLGVLIFFSNESTQKEKNIKVAIVSGNIDPKITWSETTGNALSSNYFAICKEAVNQKPDFIVWPESVFPWAYNKNDDLIKALLKLNINKESIHVLGLNCETEPSKKGISNSALFINDNNETIGTYYKNISLEGFEKPLFNKFQIPFAFSDNTTYINNGIPKPIKVKKEKAGVLICNESVEENFVQKQVKNGANFFFVMSNDGWFKDTYISLHHFYIARIFALEAKRDFAISSNCGYNGFIKSNGEIIYKSQSSEPLVNTQNIASKKEVSFKHKFPYLFTIIYLTIILSNLLLTTKTSKV